MSVSLVSWIFSEYSEANVRIELIITISECKLNSNDRLKKESTCKYRFNNKTRTE